MTTQINTFAERSRAPRKKFAIVERITPHTTKRTRAFTIPLTSLREHAVARIQLGGSWFKLFWNEGPAGRRADLNNMANALLSQPSTIILKGPCSLGAPSANGPAYLVTKVVSRPYVRVGSHVPLDVAEERIAGLLPNRACVIDEGDGPIVACMNEHDLALAKLAMC